MINSDKMTIEKAKTKGRKTPGKKPAAKQGRKQGPVKTVKNQATAKPVKNQAVASRPGKTNRQNLNSRKTFLEKAKSNFWVYFSILLLSVFFYSALLFIFRIFNFNGWLFASFVFHSFFLSVFALRKIRYSGSVPVAITTGLVCSAMLLVYSLIGFVPVFAHYPVEINVLQLLLIGFLFPFAEEAFFREGIQKSLSANFSTGSGIFSTGLIPVIVTALLAALIHIPKIMFFSLPMVPFLVLFFFLNLFWSAMYFMRESVKETTIAHSVYNVVVVLFF